MFKTELKLSYTEISEDKKGIPVIIVAAGLSSRMKGIDKQASLICGLPVLARTLMNFERSPSISSIILVIREDEIFSAQNIAEKYNISKLTDIVCGDKTRQESVLKGLERISVNEKHFLIHDGARPLTDLNVIENVVKSLENNPAVTCAVPVKDTLKQIDKNGKVLNTLDRSSLAAVQTPQGVEASLYRTAVEKVGDVSSFTDDMSIMEAAGFPVITVEGSYKNIKITTPEDLRLAEFLIMGETEE